MAKKLYAFHWYCGRAGDVHGRFVADEAEVDAAIGKAVYFGEILGKHSNVHGTLDRGDLKVVTDDQTFLGMAEKLGIDLGSGYNPLQFLAEENGQ